jgi:hypothetical protein
MLARLVSKISGFWRADEGLVTTEWVALAGAVVIGGIAVVWLVLNSLQPQASTVGANLGSCESIAASTSGNTSTCQ